MANGVFTSLVRKGSVRNTQKSCYIVRRRVTDKKYPGQIVPRHFRTRGQIVPRRFSHADKQYPVFLYMRTNSTLSYYSMTNYYNADGGNDCLDLWGN